MNKLKRFFSVVFVFVFFIFPATVFSQTDTTGLGAFRDQAVNHSHAMSMLSAICDGFGPRLSWSQGFKDAGEWVRNALKDMGLQNAGFETWEPKGRDWMPVAFHASILDPYFIPLIAYPKAYTPRTQGVIRAPADLLEFTPGMDLNPLKNRFRGHIVLLYLPQTLPLQNRNPIQRYNDSTLAQLDGYRIPDPAVKALMKAREAEDDQKKIKAFGEIRDIISFCAREGALAVVEPGYQSYGTTTVTGAVSNDEYHDYLDYYTLSSRPLAPVALPQVTVSVENYNEIYRTMRGQNKPATMELEIDVREKAAKEGFNVTAEIPGSDKKDEVVIIGAHLDSYAAGQGAADNAAGVVTCMEVARILTSLGFHPRRTIRFCFWGGEEMGLLGSKAYVAKHFPPQGNEKCQLYLNMDLGAGRFRGIYAQENPEAAAIFSEWMERIGDPGFKTVCLKSRGSSDHVSFEDAGIPGFMFIQDLLDYLKIFHSNMDTADHVPESDLKQDAFLLTAFAWFAANMEETFPRKK